MENKYDLLKQFITERSERLERSERCAKTCGAAQDECLSYVVVENEPMSKHTTFRVGGPADLFVKAPGADELEACLVFCMEHGIEFIVLGNGSNVLVSDKGIRGVVFTTSGVGDDGIRVLEETEDEVTLSVDSGVLLSKVSRYALKCSLTGLEFAEGIPGTVGGAVLMNAGAYDGEMKDVVVETRMLDKDGGVRVLQGDEHEFGYRSSVALTNGGFVLSSVLRLKKGCAEEIKAKMEDFAGRRKSKQPLELPSAGSTFKRPEGYFAGKLIQDSDLRGYKVGGAQVSEKHCGFVVNAGGATANDIMQLINDVKNIVWEKQGVALECEVRIIGEW